MPTKDDQDLRVQARQAIRKQLLPSRAPDSTFGGPGAGGRCPVCGTALRPEDMVFDLEYTDEGRRAATINFQLHVRCFAAWECERQNVQDQSDLQSGSAGATLPDSERDQNNSGQRE
jgi:hypothetical protein